jgi:hypothetical protein
VLIFSTWGFLAVAVGGVVQAQIAFQPEFREIKRRPLPKELRPAPRTAEQQTSVRPTAIPLPGGLGLGVAGRF